MDIRDSRILSNTALGEDFGDGGAIASSLSELRIANTIISENRVTGDFSASSGGISAVKSKLNITNSKISQNSVAGRGDFEAWAGGLLIFDSNLTLNQSVISGNTAPRSEDIAINANSVIQGQFNVIGIGDGSGFVDHVEGNRVGSLAQPLDIVMGTVEGDRLFGTSSDDILVGGDGYDVLYGNGGSDRLIGGRGDDQLYGASHSDETFDGGLGDDQLWLNGGADLIVLRQGDGVDTVHGFEAGKTHFSLSDGLQFSGLSFRSNGHSSQIFAGDELLVEVTWISVSQLNHASHFIAA